MNTSKVLLKLAGLILLTSCATIEPTFFPVGGVSVLREKYGPGEYYIFYSNYKFENIESPAERQDYVTFVNDKADEKSICLGESEVLLDTLGIGESGILQVTFRCIE